MKGIVSRHGLVRLSVVLTCFNAAETIDRQLGAIAGQKWSQAWELVVSDGGSTDGTPAIVERYRHSVPRLTIVDASARRGIAYGFNSAAAEAQGELLAFCESDDEVAPGWMEALGNALDEHELVACRADITKLNEPWVQQTRQHVDGLQSSWFPPYLPHSSTFGLGIRRELFDRLGGFDVAFRAMQDADLCFRAQLAGAELVYARDAVVFYRYRTAFTEIFRQARLYSEGFAQLQRKYEPPRTGPPALIRWPFESWKPILRELPRARDRAARGRLAWALGWQAGRFSGSVKHRVLAA